MSENGAIAAVDEDDENISGTYSTPPPSPLLPQQLPVEADGFTCNSGADSSFIILPRVTAKDFFDDGGGAFDSGEVGAGFRVDDDDSDEELDNDTDAELHFSVPKTSSSSNGNSNRSDKRSLKLRLPSLNPVHAHPANSSTSRSHKQRRSQSTASSISRAAPALAPPPPPPPPPKFAVADPVNDERQRAKEKKKKRKYRFVTKVTSFVPRYMASVREGRANPEGIMPKSEPALLHRLSLEQVSDVPLERIVHLRAVVRECEWIAVNNQLREPSNVKDLRRLLRVYDDYALKNRPDKVEDESGVSHQFDKEHQHALFIARMRIINVLENCTAATIAAVPMMSVGARHDDWRDLYIDNHYYVEAECIDDSQLALWMFEYDACHPGMLSVDSETGRPCHCIQSCTLECYWQSLLSLMAAWPRLPMSGYVVRLFNELRRRCAFFLAYREYSAADAKQRFEASERKVMGLHASLYTVLNFDATAPSGDANDIVAGGDAGLHSGLLENFNFATIGDDGYVNVNTEFVDQCEMIFHYMQVQIRQAVGLSRSLLDSTLSIDVLAAPYIDRAAMARNSDAIAREAHHCPLCRTDARSSITQQHIDRFEALIGAEMSGGFRQAITEEFRASVCVFLLQPSEMAEFAVMHAREVQTPLNCISRQRQADFKRIQEQLLAPQAPDVWKKLRGQLDNPAYAVIAALAINFHLQQHFKGAQFVHYYLCSEESLQPFAHLDERFALRRNVFGELHTPRVTTGTLRFRNKLMQANGINANALESDYQHPLVLRTMNSHDVVYRQHTHRVRSFAHAFLHWIELMCTDKHIAAQSPLGGALFYPLYEAMFPERAEEIKRLERLTRSRLRQYNPIVKLIGNADLDDEEDEDESDGDGVNIRENRRKNVDGGGGSKMSQF